MFYCYYNKFSWINKFKSFYYLNALIIRDTKSVFQEAKARQQCGSCTLVGILLEISVPNFFSCRGFWFPAFSGCRSCPGISDSRPFISDLSKHFLLFNLRFYNCSMSTRLNETSERPPLDFNLLPDGHDPRLTYPWPEAQLPAKHAKCDLWHDWRV